MWKEIGSLQIITFALVVVVVAFCVYVLCNMMKHRKLDSPEDQWKGTGFVFALMIASLLLGIAVGATPLVSSFTNDWVFAQLGLGHHRPGANIPKPEESKVTWKDKTNRLLQFDPSPASDLKWMIQMENDLPQIVPQTRELHIPPGKNYAVIYFQRENPAEAGPAIVYNTK